MNKSTNLEINEWKAFRIGKRAAIGMPFSCSRYREQVTQDDCRKAGKPLCSECATGERIRVVK